ncbi:MAG: periplasmic nitrate reductase, NapE protein [Hyphomicrobiales bacterium]
MAQNAPSSSINPERPAHSDTPELERPNSRWRELSGFLFLTVFLAPAVSIALVGGYGFAIWIYQLIAGPPGTP